MMAAVATVLDGYFMVSRKLRLRRRLAICRLVGDKLLSLYKLNKQTLSALLTSWSQPTPPPPSYSKFMTPSSLAFRMARPTKSNKGAEFPFKRLT